jgi:LuxR family maltose regulon positive regulatory protein
MDGRFPAQESSWWEIGLLSGEDEMATPLLQTKLYIPPVRPGLVSRPRLIERLRAGLNHKLTLISAPAGFGKTTLLSEWVHLADHPVAWLSLDEGDNDPARFWSYVVAALRAALQAVQADVGATALAMLQAPQPQPPSIEALLTGLINEILAQDPPAFALVLDDLHVLTAPQVGQGIAYLIEHLPSQMHLVLSTRADPPWPLARLRAQGEIVELRTEDLRFTLDEVTLFLNAVSSPQTRYRAGCHTRR